MDLYAVVSDIHGNYQALQAVAKDAQSVARTEGVSVLNFICLGDVVDYGPQPNECINWICRHTQLIIQGNHDRHAIEPLYEPPIGLAPDIWPITLWTRQILDPLHKSSLHEWPTRQDQLSNLKSFTLFHSSLAREDGYIDHVLAARENFEYLHTTYGLFGHTHFQGYFVEEDDGSLESPTVMFLTCPPDLPSSPSGWSPMPLDEWKPLPSWGRRAIFNPGSVGQPRRHSLLTAMGIPADYRAAYMLLRFDQKGNGDFQFRRVDYDLNKTIRLLREQVRWPSLKNKVYPRNHQSRYKLDLRQSPMNDILINIEDCLAKLIETKLIPTLRQVN